MKRRVAILACLSALPAAALSATKSYDMPAFDSVSVSAGINVDVTVGPAHGIVAETTAENFDDLEISVEDNVLHIGRAGSWSWFTGRPPRYDVHVNAPALRSLKASSGADVTVKGNVAGDFTVKASSGSDVDVSGLNGGNVKATSSSGSDLEIEGTCVSLETEASSGSDLEADGLQCENASVRTSSGSDVSVAASRQVTVRASSGSDVVVRGKPPTVNVDKSSGADVTIRD